MVDELMMKNTNQMKVIKFNKIFMSCKITDWEFKFTKKLLIYYYSSNSFWFLTWHLNLLF